MRLLNTFNGIVALPISSFLCCPVVAVIAISLTSFLIPLIPFTSNNLPNFSPTVSAGSKSQTSKHNVSLSVSPLTGLKIKHFPKFPNPTR